MPQHPIRVMVIDDDAHLSKILAETLAHAGYAVTEINDPLEAEAQVKLWGAQVVLCDIRMPGLDGIELTRRLKAHHPGVQVILMTAYPDPGTVQKGYELETVGYLLKPFRSMEVVLSTVQQALARLESYEQEARALLQSEFPGEYRILYESDHLPIPEETELNQLLMQVGAPFGTDAQTDLSEP